MDVATLRVKVSADLSDYEASLKRADAKLRSFGDAMDRLVGRATEASTERAGAAMRGLQQRAGAVADSTLKLGDALRRLDTGALGNMASQGLRSATQGMGLFGNALQSVGGILTGLSAPFRLLTGALSGLGSILGNVFGMVTQVAGALGGMLLNAVNRLTGVVAGAAKVGLAAVAAALGFIGKTGLDMNIVLEGSQRAFTRIAGSSQAAAGFIKALRAEAVTSSLTFREMLPLAQSLAGVFREAYGPSGLGRVIPTLRSFQDAAASLNVENSGLQLSLLGFRQLVSAPTASLEEIKQVDENLPGAGVRSIVRAAFGTDMSEALAKARVTGAQVGEAIVKGLRAKFGGAQAEATGSIPGLLSSISDAFTDLAATVTTGFTTRVNRSLKAFSDTITGLAQNRTVLAGLGRVFDLIGDALLGLSRQLPAATTALTRFFASARFAQFLSGAQTAFSNLMTTVQRFGAFLSENWKTIFGGIEETARIGIESVGKIFASLSPSAHESMRNILAGWSRLWEGAQAIIRFATDVVIGAISAMATTITGQVSGIGINWGDVWKNIQAATVAAVKVIGGTIAGLAGVFHGLLSGQYNLQQGFQSLGTGLKGLGVVTLRVVSEMAKQWLRLQGIIGGVQVLIGAVMVAMGAASQGAALIASGSAALIGGFVGPALIDEMTKQAGKAIQGLDTSAIGKFLGNLQKQPGPVGDFSRGYTAFGENFDKALAAAQASAAPTLPGVGTPGVPAPAGAQPAAPYDPFKTPNVPAPFVPRPPVVTTTPLPPPALPGGGFDFSPVTLPNGQTVPRWQAEMMGANGAVGTVVGMGLPSLSPFGPSVPMRPQWQTPGGSYMRPGGGSYYYPGGRGANAGGAGVNVNVNLEASPVSAQVYRQIFADPAYRQELERFNNEYVARKTGQAAPMPSARLRR